MPRNDAIRPWTEELIPELPDNLSKKDLLTFIACALRRQLEITMPEGTEIVDGEVVLPTP